MNKASCILAGFPLDMWIASVDGVSGYLVIGCKLALFLVSLEVRSESVNEDTKLDWGQLEHQKVLGSQGPQAGGANSWDVLNIGQVFEVEQ